MKRENLIFIAGVFTGMAGVGMVDLLYGRGDSWAWSRLIGLVIALGIAVYLQRRKSRDNQS